MSKKDIVSSYLGLVEGGVMFKKPISFLFAVSSILPPLFFLINSIQDDVFGEDAQAIAVVAVLVVLFVLLVLAILGILIWVRGRLSEDVGEKFVPNIYAFIKTLGMWLGTYIGLSAFLIVFLLKLFGSNEDFEAGSILQLLGLAKVGAVTWNLAILGLFRGFIIIVVSKIALFLLDKRWVIWNGILAIRRWFAGFGAVAERESHVGLGFVAILVILAGFGLLYLGATSKAPISLKAVASTALKQLTIEKASGGNLPDALSGISSQLKGKGAALSLAGADYDDLADYGATVLSRDSSSTVDAGNIGQSEAAKPASKTGALVYGGIFCFLLGIVTLGFLTLRKRQ
jgi:hypothetical protein